MSMIGAYPLSQRGEVDPEHSTPNIVVLIETPAARILALGNDSGCDIRILDHSPEMGCDPIGICVASIPLPL